MDHSYEKLNKQTMEPQLDTDRITELSEVKNYSDQFHSLMVMLHSQHLKHIDIISQRMFSMAMHQLNFWLKSNHRIPQCIFSPDDNKGSHNQNNHHASIYPTSMDRGFRHQGFDVHHDSNMKQCGSNRHDSGDGRDQVAREAFPGFTDCDNDGHGMHCAADFNFPYLSVQRHPMSCMRNQNREDTVPEAGSMNHHLKPQDDGIKDNMDVKNHKQHYFLPRVDVNLCEDFAGNLLPNVNPTNSESPKHGPGVGVDSFGLPLTTFERDAKYNTN